jgi:hypothetical protein
MLKERRHHSSFLAEDASGRKERLDVFIDIHDAASIDDPNSEIQGLKQIQTSAGEPVSRLERGKYQIVQSGQILTSHDPEAF